MPQVVFVTLFLGLITGTQPVQVRVAPGVAAVRLELAGREVGRLTGPSWGASIDFGGELLPEALTAIALDAAGNETGRATQAINIARPVAELEVAIRSEGEHPVAVELIGRHRTLARMTASRASIDGTALRARGFTFALPRLDWTRPHVVSAEVRFADRSVARREAVLEAGFSASAGTELAPVAVTTTASTTPPESLDGCFSAAARPIRATAIESGDGLVVMVRDPDAVPELNTTRRDSAAMRFDASVVERVLWPVARPINAPGEQPALMFPPSRNLGPSPLLSSLFTQRLLPRPKAKEPRLYADAVAVAAMSTLERPQRRAVVLLLSRGADASLFSPQTVRRYAAAIGVPLFVWSPDGPRPDAAAWGTIDDVSTAAGLDAAMARLQRTLREQRIVWLAADPLTALAATASPRCGVTALAHR